MLRVNSPGGAAAARSKTASRLSMLHAEQPGPHLQRWRDFPPSGSSVSRGSRPPGRGLLGSPGGSPRPRELRLFHTDKRQVGSCGARAAVANLDIPLYKVNFRLVLAEVGRGRQTVHHSVFIHPKTAFRKGLES